MKRFLMVVLISLFGFCGNHALAGQSKGSDNSSQNDKKETSNKGDDEQKWRDTCGGMCKKGDRERDEAATEARFKKMRESCAEARAAGEKCNATK